MGGKEVEVSEPVVSYQETIMANSSQICLAKSPNKHNRLWMTATPLQRGFAEDVEEGRIDPEGDVKVRRFCRTIFNATNINCQSAWAYIVYCVQWEIGSAAQSNVT